MGNFSRNTFDKLKHFVGVRLQQGVPLVDADWNELEDIRKYELQAFLKWFVGDGVPEDNDGFRIVPLVGGGVNAIVLMSNLATPGPSSVVVNSAASTAATVLGFGAENREAVRSGSSPARLTGDVSEPFALTAGMTLSVRTDDQTEETVTFQAAGFVNIGSATAAEVVAAINNAMNNLTASVGTGNDFEIMGGDGTPERAGRCLVDGRDAINERRLKYSAQPLYENTALAAEWDVDPLPPLAPPPTGQRTDTVYLHIWEREVNTQEDDALINPLIGVESCVRLKREWAVRVRSGGAVPVAQPGHAYLDLATIVRRAGVNRIAPADVTDIRPRNLMMPPSTLIEDVFGVSLQSYRQGQGRPAINLREVINALLRGELPSTPDTPIAPATAQDFMSYAFTIGGSEIVALWHSRRAANVNQIFVTHWAMGNPATAATNPPQQITPGPLAHALPSTVVLPAGDLVVVYETSQQDIHFKRGTPTTLVAAIQTDVATATGVAKRQPFAVLAGDLVIFFWHQGQGTPDRRWQYRRWRHLDNTWIDNAPQQHSATNAASASGGLGDFHAAVDGNGDVWAAFRADDTNNNFSIRLVRLRPAAAQVEEQTLSIGGANEHLFVLIDGSEAVWVFWRNGPDATSNIVYQRINLPPPATWAVNPPPIAVSGGSNARPCAIRDNTGAVWLFWSRAVAIGSNRAVWVRRHNKATNGWGDERQITGSAGSDDQPYAIIGPGGVVWLFWISNRTGNLDLYSKQFVSAI
jgi:hypothetical protein